MWLQNADECRHSHMDSDRPPQGGAKRKQTTPPQAAGLFI